MLQEIYNYATINSNELPLCSEKGTRHKSIGRKTTKEKQDRSLMFARDEITCRKHYEDSFTLTNNANLQTVAKMEKYCEHISHFFCTLPVNLLLAICGVTQTYKPLCLPVSQGFSKVQANNEIQEMVLTKMHLNYLCSLSLKN